VTADKHYDFSAIEQSARNRAAIVNLIGSNAVICCYFAVFHVSIKCLQVLIYHHL